MKALPTIAALLLCLLFAGCQEPRLIETGGTQDLETHSQYIFMPAKIRITQLTDFVKNDSISAYVDVVDEFGSRIKAPGLWRFELYDYVPRSAEPKGTRVYIWTGIDLRNAEKNNEAWQDFMRSYKFDLNMENDLAEGKTYVLTAILFNAQGKRIIDSVQLKL